MAVQTIRDLFERRGTSNYGGEAVTQLEHALQAAEWAEKEGANAELIVAALLHDIGHLCHDLPDDAPDDGIDDCHEDAGSAFLIDRFPEAVIAPVRMHVAAKRYLCATEPEYMAQLSEPSLTSLRLQGGPMTPEEILQFEQQPFSADAIRLRRWDDLAKVVDHTTPDLEHYLTLVDQVSLTDSGDAPQMHKDHYDVAIVGAGILGLAQAWMAAKRGLRVIVLERTPVAQGATVRNFGMIWPIGQTAGEMYAIALKSRELWLELKEQAVLEVEACGSLHLAHREDEMVVLEEFVSLDTHPAKLLSPAETLNKAPITQASGLLGSMQSNTELRVNPRQAAQQIAKWLAERHHVQFEFDTPVVAVNNHKVTAADRRTWHADRVIICSGSDLQTLFPETFQDSNLRLCKLQMLSTNRTPAMQVVPHIASGLTLRHYTAFQACASLKSLRTRIAKETPELDQYGIHVMASIFPDGRVILGDSHEYDAAISPFDSVEIDNLMLRELRKILALEDWSIAQRWHGIYAKHPSEPLLEKALSDSIFVFLGTGGAGMTMGFGLADRWWARWD